MLSDELKSAVELALERLEEEMGDSIPKLSQSQKERIADIRRKYQAKIAEIEIAAQSEIKKKAEAGTAEFLEAVKKKSLEDKNRLQSEMDRHISRIREE